MSAGFGGPSAGPLPSRPAIPPGDRPTYPSGEGLADAGLGVVAIGRNEGERLRRCLQSVLPHVARVVYVDSGSTDGSAAMARGLGAEVVDLDLSQPFTAARARNAGLARLMALQPGLERVQFVDGDCEVVDGWLSAATAFLAQRPDVGVVCGRRRERHPERSVYNRLCDAEWNTPVGEARACGGDAMMRVAALQAVGGYREDLIAGEEPELCVRLRAAGWRVWRLDHEMTLHDAAMLRFGQWWRRTQRGGHAFAEGTALHGAPPERHWVRETRSGLAWGLGMPLAILLLALAVSPWALALFAVYPLQVLRLSRRGQGFAHALFLVLGKFPEALGQLNYWWRRLTHGQRRLIEYK